MHQSNSFHFRSVCRCMFYPSAPPKQFTISLPSFEYLSFHIRYDDVDNSQGNLETKKTQRIVGIVGKQEPLSGEAILKYKVLTPTGQGGKECTKALKMGRFGGMKTSRHIFCPNLSGVSFQPTVRKGTCFPTVLTTQVMSQMNWSTWDCMISMLW